MKNYNSNKIDSLVSFTETDLRVDRHYQNENFTRSNLGYKRQGNEDQISTAFNKNDDLAVSYTHLTLPTKCWV